MYLPTTRWCIKGLSYVIYYDTVKLIEYMIILTSMRNCLRVFMHYYSSSGDVDRS